MKLLQDGRNRALANTRQTCRSRWVPTQATKLPRSTGEALVGLVSRAERLEKHERGQALVRVAWGALWRAAMIRVDGKGRQQMEQVRLWLQDGAVLIWADISPAIIDRATGSMALFPIRCRLATTTGGCALCHTIFCRRQCVVNPATLANQGRS
ncbi:hypothetical protein HDV63DRAFT_213295 [Trichoderma sp. SZMC 28014]